MWFATRKVHLFALLKRAATTVWRNRIARIVMPLTVLAAAILLQYRLANIPLPLDVDSGSPYRLVAAQLYTEELLVDSPSQQAANPAGEGTKLFSGLVEEFVAVDVHFDAARLSDEDLNSFRRHPPPTQTAPPPPGDHPIDYSSVADGTTPDADHDQPTNKNNRPCRTAVEVVPLGGSMPSELHFFQSERSGTDNYRYFQIKASADLLVKLLTMNQSGDPQAAGCGKTLSIAGGTIPLIGPFQVGIVAPAGTGVRFAFTPFSREARWKSKPDFEPFLFENSRLVAHGLRRLGRNDSAAISTSVSADNNKPLILKHLFVRADAVEMEFSGKAMVQKNGKYVETFDLLRFATNNPLPASLLAMLDGALLEWIRRSVFRSTKRKPKDSRPRKKKRKSETGDHA